MTLTLALRADNTCTELTITRAEVLPHKRLDTTVLAVIAPTDGIVRLAQATMTVVLELERLHRRGYALRERSVGLRGIWHNDLLSVAGHCVATWQTQPRRPHKDVAGLAATLSKLDVPAAHDVQPDRGDVVAQIMREHGHERRREHAVDQFLATNPLSTVDELIEHLEQRGLLSTIDDV